MNFPLFRPLITNFYITKQCNLKCRYCYPPGDEPDSQLADAAFILTKIRPHNPVINFTGGEPLLYQGLPFLLRKARELEFYPIILSTNGLLLDKLQNDLDLVDHLIISLDSLSQEVNDNLSGVTGITERIINNIRKFAGLSRKNQPHLSLHSVITPESIEGIEDIVNFCDCLGVTLSISPEHGQYYPNSKLVQNKNYIKLIDRLYDMKKMGKPIACSYLYLKKIRDFSSHKCYPYISPRVEPDGRVYFPCQRVKERHAYIQDYNSLLHLMHKETDRTFMSACSQRCFLACYLEVEQYLKNPFNLLREYSVRNWVLGKRIIPSINE